MLLKRLRFLTDSRSRKHPAKNDRERLGVCDRKYAELGPIPAAFDAGEFKAFSYPQAGEQKAPTRTL
jgi:hypothetical protein